ncbi:MAG TPA: sigma-70 family RNA polymerase sigma factor [Gemmataceae bacterium]|nr:sigma-70 family RNA polymerase sigma factor [Gemmataceae bacterium]
MSGPPTTRLTLVARLRDVGDAEAWAEFVDLYAPLLYGLARRHGFQDADAADVTQDVLRAVVGALPRLAYDPARGSFRGWLFTVARNQVRKLANARKRQPCGSGGPAGDDVLRCQPAPEEEEAAWEREYRERLFAWAAGRVRDQFRPATWEAFWQTYVEGGDPRAVGEALGMSVGAVYIARTRVLARVREQVRRHEDE